VVPQAAEPIATFYGLRQQVCNVCGQRGHCFDFQVCKLH
jgi:hypothetical protein